MIIDEFITLITYRCVEGNRARVPSPWLDDSVDLFQCYFHWEHALVNCSECHMKILKMIVRNVFLNTSRHF